MKYFTDLEFFTNKIKTSEPFAYARYADGEVALMKGNGISTSTQAYQQDKWSAPNQITKVGKQLLETLSHTESNYYYAISTDQDSKSDYDFLMSHIKSPNITFANLWINANYGRMKAFYTNLNQSVYVICNHRANKYNFPFDVTELFPFPDDCVWFWENHGERYLEQLLDYTSQLNGQTIFVSAGPISEILIHSMYVANPNNQYIDVGSSIDFYVHGKHTRPYMDWNSPYSKEVSQFTNEL